MIKGRCFLFLFVLIGIPFAAETQNRTVFIEGTGANPLHNSFFIENFQIEGRSAGYNITETREEADHTFRFQVMPNMITYDDGTQSPPPPDEPQFSIVITLIDNESDEDMVSFGFHYSALDDMYEFTQFLFLRAVVNIPYEPVENGIQSDDPIDTTWQNKWLYLRLSADYTINFYQLLSTGLGPGGTVYGNNPDDYTPVDNRTTALPAATIGLQVQILDWLSLEPNFQFIFFDDGNFLTMAAGARLLFPIKSVRNVLLEPYAAFSYPVRTSDLFLKFPLYAAGAGLQIGIQGGSMGVLFVDINYMYSPNDAVLENPYGVAYPNPPGIHFRRTAIGLGIGYKFGILDRGGVSE